VNKHLVFYSESSGFYKYYQGIIEWLLAHTNLTIHYITSDPEDQIFALAEKEDKIRAYYIGEKRLKDVLISPLSASGPADDGSIAHAKDDEDGCRRSGHDYAGY
jgi:hypothetical protein